MTNNLELKEKAFQYVKEKRWDYLLAHAFLTIENYPFWSDRSDSDTDWNIGLNDISAEKRPLYFGQNSKEAGFVKANLDGIVFEIGGFRDSFLMPYNEKVFTLVISLLITERVVLTIRYHSDSDAYSAQQYSMTSVDELHVDSQIDGLLISIERLTKKHKILQSQKEAEQRNRQYEGKFSFGVETESETQTNTLSQSTNESASFKVGKIFGKIFK